MNPPPPPGVGIPDVVAAPMVIMGDRMNDDSSTKTVHVGNVDPLATEEELISMFSPCGPISFVRILGETGDSRYAFVEFMEVGGCAAAFLLNGAMLRGRSIKINRSHNGLVKPSCTTDHATQARLKAAMARLNNKIAEEEKKESKEEKDLERNLANEGRGLETDRKKKSERGVEAEAQAAIARKKEEGAGTEVETGMIATSLDPGHIEIGNHCMW
eukprot:CAMPEP_0174305488 /NCGR_PEP_ID=MMETSP0809-20121228/61441_1 /TAXON_ID=73025 ORGANISM="Eutreptiella gymnastica-like, Strain CCMP1594" /NCGR_SAMPLE_ID=MMETSP0809 /ASSEMBLY_ACC=CAM_ASM_000658 /LENGTH=214 /DNA_ID=CAMNT_0015411977 /DNA_START=25 /DNA_END=667 /DNA_ORIENTATION=-